MRRTKKALSILLTLVMVFTMIPAVTLTFTEKAQAYGTYSKNHTREYYYTSGTVFISAVCSGYDGSSLSTVQSQMRERSWTPISSSENGNVDLAQGVKSAVYSTIGYRTTTDPSQAITGVHLYGGSKIDQANRTETKPNAYGESGSYTFNEVNRTASGEPEYFDGHNDYLKDGKSCGYGYVYVCRAYDFGPPVSSIQIFTSTSTMSTGGWTAASSNETDGAANTTRGAGTTKYIGYKSSCTAVNSDTLRSNYTTALGRYNESNYSAKYTSASRSALESALSTAEGILSDLSDGYTTSNNQTAINNAANALSTAVNGLTLNTYTVTFTGYTSGTTSGTLKTETVSYGGSATPPASVATTYTSSNHYTFTGWNGTYTNVTSARTVTANYSSANHSYSSAVLSNATCTAAGSTKYSCTGCSYTYTDNTVPAALNHDFSSQTATDAYLASAATCTAKAVYYYKCSRCSEKGSATYEYGEALGHSYTGDYVNQSAGKHYRKCERFAACGTCGLGVTQNATENCFGGTATCTAQAVCYACHTAYGSTLTHNYLFDSFVWADDNKTAQAKVICEHCEDEKLVAAEMSEDAHAATCGADAYTVYTATYGEETDSKTVTDAGTALTHNYLFDSFVWADDNKTAQAKVICEHCEDEKRVAAEMSEDAHAATCGADAYTVYTATYGEETDSKTVTDAGTALTHDFVYTPNGDGTHTVTCSRCAYRDENVACSFGSAAVKQAATCSAKGVSTYTCGVCDYAYDETNIDIDPLNHTDAEGVSTLVRTEAAEATCTTDGNPEYWYCTACEKYYLTADGSDEGKTSAPVLHDENAHSYGEMVREVSATCIAEGVKAHCTCAYCGKNFDADHNVLESLVIGKLDHDLGEWINEEPASCTEAGTKGHYTCSMCGDPFDADENPIDDLAIPAAGHTFPLLHVDAKEAGCPHHAASHAPRRSGSPVTVTGNDGNIEYWYCDACGAYFADADAATPIAETDIVIPAAHSLTHVAAVAATFETEGNKEYWVCSVCGDYYANDAGTQQIEDKTSVIIPKLTPETPTDPAEPSTDNGGCGTTHLRISIWEWLMRIVRTIMKMFRIGDDGRIC